MVTYNFIKFIVNGQDASGPSFNLTMDRDYTVEAVYDIVPPPQDILMETYKGLPIWQSVVTGFFYIKDSAGVIIRDLLTSVEEARAWIDAYAPSPNFLLPIAIIGGIVMALGKG